MKKIVALALACLALLGVLAGCGQKEEPVESAPPVYMGNPWSDWGTIEEAEKAVGFAYGLPTLIDDRYTVAAYRTMNNELLEVIYRWEEIEFRVRKQAGEGQDISGDYTEYDTCTQETLDGGEVTRYQNQTGEKLLISCKGYSWSVTAFDGYGQGAAPALAELILKA